VKPGDLVAVDQVVADVMTDKATVEVPSPIAGRVIALGGEAGEKLAVGGVLARLESEGGDESAAPSPPAAAPREAPATAMRTAPSIPEATASAKAPPASIPEGAVHAPAGSSATLAAPSVRRHARELGIDLRTVAGSGPGGRVLHEDLERVAGKSAAKPAAPQRYAERSGEQAVPVIGLRRTIAQRMQEAVRRIPHFTYVEEVDVTELEALRARLNAERGEARGRLTVLPFLMRAIVLAAPSFPQMNARYDDEKDVVIRHAAVHIGIATQTAGGLMVPVVRHAETRDLWSSAAEIGRLADAARAGKASREELSGSTITITSLGPLGGIVTTPILNAPEVAIVGVNRIVERPAIVSGAMVPRKLMNLSSSFDHRVVDGHDAARFVQALRGYLECPAMLFVD
jgi:2-oxoisovalerate dehydrogenase E2 component (dihydrolipoyl transacylase)